MARAAAGPYLPAQRRGPGGPWLPVPVPGPGPAPAGAGPRHDGAGVPGDTPLSVLAAPAVVVAPTLAVREVDTLFRRDRTLRAVVVEGAREPRLVERSWFAHEMAGPLGFGRMLLDRATMSDVATPPGLALPGRTPLTLAAVEVLGHGGGEAVLDSVLVTGGDGLGVVAVPSLLRHAASHFAHQARHDPLTSLPNRLFLMDLVRADADGVHALVYVDLDRFKDVNDVHGHQAGDAVIVEFAERLRAATRAGDLVVRLGGDEFVLAVLTPLSDASLRSLADRLVLAAAAPFVVTSTADGRPHEATVTIGASVGVATRDGESGSGSLEVLIRHADLAMYRAKNQGRGRVQNFHESRREIATESRQQRSAHAIERRLRGALAAGALSVHYQPIVSLRAGEVVELEALLRWSDAELGPVAPDDFIPIAESSGLVVEIGRWVLEEACRTAAAWPANGRGEHPGVSVNVSAVELGEPDLVAHVMRALDRSGLPAERLCLEITETATLTDIPAAIGRLSQLRAAGVRVALDDFGIGRASLTLLQRLPLDVLKIDRSFTSALTRSDADSALVQLVVDAAHALGLTVCTEGVETSAQAHHAAGHGADRAQGWLFGRPVADGPGLHAAIRGTAASWAGAVPRARRHTTPPVAFTMVVGADGIVHFLSPEGAALLGLPSDAVIGTHLSEHMADEDLAALAGVDASAPFERTVAVRDGRHRPVRLHVRGEPRRYEAAGPVVRVVCRVLPDAGESAAGVHAG